MRRLAPIYLINGPAMGTSKILFVIPANNLDHDFILDLLCDTNTRLNFSSKRPCARVSSPCVTSATAPPSGRNPSWRGSVLQCQAQAMSFLTLAHWFVASRSLRFLWLK
jgi:hypothetical protein